MRAGGFEEQDRPLVQVSKVIHSHVARGWTWGTPFGGGGGCCGICADEQTIIKFSVDGVIVAGDYRVCDKQNHHNAC